MYIHLYLVLRSYPDAPSVSLKCTYRHAIPFITLPPFSEQGTEKVPP